MLLQILAQGFPQNAHAASVDDAHPRHAGQKRAVHEFFDFAGGFVHGVADDVDFGRHVAAADFALQRDADPAGARGFDGRVGDACLHFGDIFAGDAHFHRADFDIEVVVANFLFDDGGATPDGGLIKLGAGTNTLTAASTYTGSTVVSNGTLVVNGSLAASAVTV